MKKANAPARDFLAIILIGMGSSYARGPDKDDQIERVVKIAFSDWSSLYDLAGKEVSVNVYEIPDGIDSVWWDERGVFAEGRKEPLERLELVKREFPAKRRRRA